MQKNILAPYALIKSQTIAADFISPVVNIKYLDRLAIEYEFGAGLVGTVNVEGSVSGNTWSPILPALAPNGTYSVSLQDIINTAICMIRLRFLYTSGPGVLSVWIAGKES